MIPVDKFLNDETLCTDAEARHRIEEDQRTRKKQFLTKLMMQQGFKKLEVTNFLESGRFRMIFLYRLGNHQFRH